MNFRMLCVLITLALTLNISAQIPTGNPGDLAVYNNAGAAAVTISSENGSNPERINVFNNTVVTPSGSYVKEPASDGIKLSAGKHLVFYSVRPCKTPASRRWGWTGGTWLSTSGPRN